MVVDVVVWQEGELSLPWAMMMQNVFSPFLLFCCVFVCLMSENVSYLWRRIRRDVCVAAIPMYCGMVPMTKCSLDL
jgi:hypothetical protein